MSFDRESERILDLLYAAPGDLTAWTRFLEEFSRFIDASPVSYVSFDDANQEYTVDCTSGFPPEDLRLYQEHYAAIDEWYLRAKGQVSAGYADDGQALCPVDELRRTEFYNDFLKPNGWIHECAAVLELKPSAITALTLLRTARQPEFSSREIDVLRAFAPHIRRAARLHRRFLDLKLRSKCQNWALNKVSFGLVFLRPDGTVFLANDMARRICNGDGLSLSARGICATGSQDSAVNGLLKELRRPRLWPATQGMAVVRRRNGSPLLLTMGPVPARTVDSIGPLVAVFIHDPADQHACPQEALRKVYGLTQAESRLTLLLAEGLGVPEAAERLGVTAGTARIQLKAVFQKTSTRRQSELARLVANLQPTAIGPIVGDPNSRSAENAGTDVVR